MVVPLWVLWNTGLALLPLALAALLFRRRPDGTPVRPGGPLWWAGAAAFVALLPNAPYVLTDVIHFDDSIRRSTSDAQVALVLLPGWLAFFAVGFGSYVACVVRVERWLRASGWSLPRLLGADVTLHALAAAGVFVGRFFRFNSWDIVLRPTVLLDLVRVPQPRSLALYGVTFAVLAVGTAAIRYGTGLRIRARTEPRR